MACQPLGQDHGEGKEDGAAGNGDHPGVKRRGCWAGHNQNANKAKQYAKATDQCQALSKQKGGQNNHPKRGGEFKRKDLGQGDEGNSKEPQVLSGEMGQVSKEVTFDPVRFYTPLAGPGAKTWPQRVGIHHRPHVQSHHSPI